jgi:hypothetical protein
MIKYVATFKPVQNQFNAAVGDNGGDYDLFDYSTAYFDASLALANKVIQEGVISDSVVYPICYTFRHGTELFIKYLIDDLGRLAGTWDEYKPGHSLLKNWKRAQKLLIAIETASVDIEFFDKVVKDFEQIDQSGMAFRYPETIDRNPLLKDLKTINIAIIGNNCQGISEIAKTWGRLVYTAMESAVENGTLSPAAMRPVSKRPFGVWWRRFLRSAKETRQQLMLRGLSGRPIKHSKRKSSAKKRI